MVSIIVFAPLIGALICGLGWRWITERGAMLASTGLMLLAMVLSWALFISHDGDSQQIVLLRWIESGSLSADWAIRLDRLTTIMLALVCTVSALAQVYSFGALQEDPNWREGQVYRPRFFAYLSFLSFAMLVLVSSDNLVQLLFGWELVSLASYLLIGFYWRKPATGAAALKAFVLNRIGSVGLALGVFALYFLTDSVSFDVVFAAAPALAETELRLLGVDWNAADLAAVLLFFGAMAISAQLFLHSWLSDAVVGPAPASALIFGATTLSAGVFMLCRLSPLYEYAPAAQSLVLVIGASTAFFAASVALVQTDIRRVLAYASCSQLGLMLVAVGVGAYSVALLHLLSQALIMALLFLAAGSVIRAMQYTPDMRKFGGLRQKLPFTYWSMLIGLLALSGVGVPLTQIGLSGFVSQGAVFASVWAAQAPVTFGLLAAAMGLTGFYSLRLLLLSFHGKRRGDKKLHEEVSESPASMRLSLGVLALLVVLAGMVFVGPFFGSQERVNGFFGMPVQADQPAQQIGATPVGALFMAPDNTVLQQAKTAPEWVRLAPLGAVLAGFGLAWLFYLARPELPVSLARDQRLLYRLLFNGWYLEALYDAALVRLAHKLGQALWKRGDGRVLNGAVNGLALGLLPRLTRLAGRLQSGNTSHYALAMVIGLGLLLVWAAIGGGSE